MRKIMLLVAVLMLASPALAAVTITATQVGEDVEISYSTTGNLPRAFALEVTVDNGNVASASGYKQGESSNAAPGYGIYPDSIAVVGNEVTGWGTPVVSGAGSGTMILEFGSLYDMGASPSDAPATSGVLCTLQLGTTNHCNVGIALNALRGGLVMEDPNEVVVPSLNGCTYLRYARPACWGYDALCYGDAEGDNDADFLDAFIWKNAYLPAGHNWGEVHGTTQGFYNPCGDFDQDGDADFIDAFAWKNTYLGVTPITTCSPHPSTKPWPPSGY